VVCKENIENGFGKEILVLQIDTQLHRRQGAAINNFNAALPPTDSDLTAQIFKDPYIFNFLVTADPRREAELEKYRNIKSGMIQNLLRDKIRLV